jgi:hypothetical protein
MSQSLLLTNTGAQPLVFSQISLGGPHPEDYVLTNSCPGTVAVGGNCSLTAAFSPTATGSLSASVQVTSNATIVPYLVIVGGLGQ